MTNPHLGSSFESFLEEEGLADEAAAHAVKRVLVWQIQQAMQADGLTKSEMARRMRTSRAQLDRLLDPENDRVRLETLQRAAGVLGRSLRLELA